MSLANLLKPSPGPLTPGVWKRKGSDEDEDDHQSNRIKRPRYSWYVTLEDESRGPTEEDSDNESIYSVQDEETEYARDTSDASTEAWINPGDHSITLDVEYELATTSESDNPFLDSSTSDPEDILTVDILAAISESEDLYLDRVEDSDATSTSIDSELGKADYWTCVQCNTTNNNPLFRYCEKCYQLRKNLFPPRPRGKKRTQKSANNTEGESSQNSEVLDRIDSGLGSSQLSQISTSDVVQEISTQSSILSTTDTLIDTKIGNQEIEIINVVDDKNIDKREKRTDYDKNEIIEEIKPIQSEFGSPDDDESKNCLVCTVKPKNGAFVHGNASHICCCYRCAVKVWRKTRHCPICKRRVTNVLKAYFA